MSGDSGRGVQSTIAANDAMQPSPRPSTTQIQSTFLATVRACRATLAQQPSGLLTDVDGTISPIVLDPSSAMVLPGCRAALAALSRQLDLVGVLSGRRAEDARAMVGVDGIEYLGVHGMVRWTPEGTLVHAEAAEFVTLMDDAYREVKEQVQVPGVVVEHKGPCLAIHYRQALDPLAARQHILRELSTIAEADGLAIAEGRMVVELRPPAPLGKGWMVEDLAQERSLVGLIYLGDDRTDLEAFHAIRSWREAGPGRYGIALAVASPEMPSTLVEAADYVLDDVPAVELLLTHLATNSETEMPAWR
jgi:trehalose-phosphatase